MFILELNSANIRHVIDLQYFYMSHSTQYSSFSDRKSNKQQPSKVLLKGEVTKFFIEFTTIHNACNAKTVLDGTKFFDNICKMNIYFSNFNNVDLKHEFSEGADFEEIEQKSSYFIQNFENLTKSSHEKNINFLDDDILMQTFLPFGSNNSFARSKTDNPRRIEAEIIKMQNSDKIHMIEEEEVDKEIKNEIQSLLQEQESVRGEKSSRSIKSQYNSQRNLSSSNMKVDIETLNNNSVVSYDIKEWIPLRQVYNLFSNFGNIESIVSKKQKIFIKFRSGYFAAVAVNYLCGLYFCKNYLNLNYCLNPEEYEQKPFEYSESIYFDESYDRFTPKRSITVNPPSQTLHISSVKKENCNEASLRKMVSVYGTVEKIKILMQSNEKNMALVKFSSMRQSFEAISDLHNKHFGGRKMQISFTKSKL